MVDDRIFWGCVGKKEEERGKWLRKMKDGDGDVFGEGRIGSIFSAVFGRHYKEEKRGSKRDANKLAAWVSSGHKGNLIIKPG